MSKYKGLRKRLELLNLIEDDRFRSFIMPDGSMAHLTAEETRQAFSDALSGKKNVVLCAFAAPSYGSGLLDLLHACVKEK